VLFRSGPIGEYIRTGLDYNQWLENFCGGVAIASHARQMRIDFTLTLPGMFEVGRVQTLARDLQVGLLAKVVFSFSPDIVMSPLALPRELLHSWIDEILGDTLGGINHVPDNSPLRDILVQLKTRPTFAEQWPDTYQSGLIRGKQRILTLEKIRKDVYTMRDILAERPAVLKWWDSIETS
jgi:hypothetical protein